MTLNLAETSVVKSRVSVLHVANFIFNRFVSLCNIMKSVYDEMPCNCLIFQLLLCQVVGQFLTGHREFQSWIHPYIVRDVMHENFKVSH